MPGHSDEPEYKRDWRVSAILAAIWFIALIVVVNSDLEIPTSMLVVATAFFVILIPAMNDVVHTAERLARGRDAATDSDIAGGDRDGR